MSKPKGFATMSLEQRQRIAAMGGKSHSLDHLREIGRRGGLRTQERARMSIKQLKRAQRFGDA